MTLTRKQHGATTCLGVSGERAAGRAPRLTRVLASAFMLVPLLLLDASSAEACQVPVTDRLPSTMPTAPALDAPPLTQEELDFFERRIRPVLADHCYSCHSADAERLRGQLRVDSSAGLLAGGASGPAIEPGDPAASLLIEAMRWEDELLQMPPKRRLPDAVIADFERWIAMGAPDPRGTTEPVEALPPADDAMDIEARAAHWSFQPPVAHAAPAVQLAEWPESPIDTFVLARLEAEGLRPVRDADRATLLRRVTFDLTGLPPTPEAIEAFSRDRRPDALERVVDELLASSAFGERWGRHWLDVARYAESSGRDVNILYPHAWRYRDYVIDAFNADKPYDRFLREQIAGDLLPYDTPEQRAELLVATGYLAVGSKAHNTRGRAQFEMDVADEQIDAVTRGTMALTVACARCHDHKFDPVPTRDYYAMAGIFLSTDTRFGTPPGANNRHAAALIALPEDADVPAPPGIGRAERAALARQLERLTAQRDELEADVRVNGRRNNPAAQRLRQVGQRVAIMEQILARHDEDGSPRADAALAMGAAEGRPRDARLLVRGELDRGADLVPRGFVSVLEDAPASIERGSGRLELADWIASPSNPLTARVLVNRAWLHLMGRALVPTPDNFGRSGLAPTHPELLDHLALEFVEDGWSVKRLVRRIVLSHTYRLSTDHDRRSAERDPDAALYWRMIPRRLEGEAIRDAMLAAAGTLELERPAGSDVAALEGPVQLRDRRRALGNDRARRRRDAAPVAAEPVHRSVYLTVVRDDLPEALEVFDFADPSFVSGDRDETTVPSQSLYLLNDDAVARAADAMAQRLLAMDADDDERARQAFHLTLGRAPSPAEMQAVRRFFRDFPAAQGTAPDAARDDGPPRRRRGARRGDGGTPDAASAHEALRALGFSTFCQSLFATAEFRTLD